MDPFDAKDLLNADPRPAFVVDLTASFNEGPVSIVFRNKILRERSQDFPKLLESVTTSWEEFSWVCMSDDGSTNEYRGVQWVTYTVRQRWRVVQVLHDWARPPTSRKVEEPVPKPKHRWRNTSPNISPKDPPRLLDQGSEQPPPGVKAQQEIINSVVPRNVSKEVDALLDHIAIVDWSQTSMGPMHTWSEAFLTLFALIMMDPDPKALAIGDDLCLLYNAAYAKLGAARHPSIMGVPYREAWPENNEHIERGVSLVQKTRWSYTEKRLQTFVKVDDHLQERIIKWIVIPLQLSIPGYFVEVIDNTHHMVGGRRAAHTMYIREELTAARELESYWKILLESMLQNEFGMPLGFLYTMHGTPELDIPLRKSRDVKPGKQICRLEGILGVSDDVLPSSFELESMDVCFARRFREAALYGRVAYLHSEDGTLPKEVIAASQHRGFGDPVRTAAVLPLRGSDEKTVRGILVIGLNTRRPYDALYQEWTLTFLRTLNDLLTNTLDIMYDRDAMQKEHRLLASALARREKEALRIKSKFERLQSLADMSDVAFFESNLSGMLTQANDSWYRQTGHPRDPSLTNDFSWVDCIHDDDKDFVMSKWISLARGHQLTFEMRWKTRSPQGGSSPSSNATWVLAVCGPTFDENGTMEGISGCLTDITAQKKSQRDSAEKLAALERARASEARFARFIEVAPVAIYIIGTNGELAYCNDSWFELTTHPKVPFDKVDWKWTIIPEDLPYVEATFGSMLEGVQQEGAVIHFRIRASWTGPDGEITPSDVLVSAYPELDKEGNITGVMGTAIDISHLKWQERLQERRTQDAVKAKQQTENFIDVVSHEIRNPLSAVVHCTETLSQGIDEMESLTGGFTQVLSPVERESMARYYESARDAVATISTCSAHQQRLVDDILTVSKMDSKLIQITPSLVQARGFLQEMHRMFDSEAKRAGVTLQIREEDSLQAVGVDWVMLDYGRTTQVLINLITNALKFTQKEPRRGVTIGLGASIQRPDDDSLHVQLMEVEERDVCGGPEWGVLQPIYLHFRVSDTGCGMGDSEMAKIFYRFAQGTPRTHTKYGGSGLGLFISRQLCELMGGSIGVASAPGEGSTFAFFVKARKGIPRRESPPRRHSSGSSISSSFELPADKCAILLVEDNLINQKVLSGKLQKIGYNVRIASDGSEALDIIKQSNRWRSANGTGPEISIILMDIEMPVMDGITCTRCIREFERQGNIVSHIPIIAVSANARGQQVEDARAAGMDDSVSKPFQISELVQKITRLTA